MMKLTKELQVALGVLTVMKTKTSFVRTEDLAKEVGTTTNFLEQIIRDLRRANIVTVKRGPGGGHMLNTGFGTLTAYHVAQALGRDLGAVKFDEAPTSRLHKSIVEAFLNTSV
jgi:Rrf2 family protein